MNLHAKFDLHTAHHRSPAAAFNPIIEIDQPSSSHTLSPAWKSNFGSSSMAWRLTKTQFVAVPLIER